MKKSAGRVATAASEPHAAYRRFAGRFGRLRDDLALVTRSFGAAPSAWIGAICAGIFLTVAATLVGERIDADPGYLFGEFRFEGQYAGVMTALCTVLLGGAGLSLFTVSWLYARTEATHRFVFPWAIAAAGMFVLAADDLLFVHELVAYRLADRGVPFVIGENVLLVVYAAGTLLVLPRLLQTVRRHWRSAFPLAFGLAMFALSVALDFVVPSAARESGAGWAFALVDRAGKVLGTAMMLLFAQVLLVEVAGESSQPRDRSSPSHRG